MSPEPMPNPELIDLALSFLTDPHDEVVLQLWTHESLRLARRAVVARLGAPKDEWALTLVYPGPLTVQFELATWDCAGRGWACPVFLVEEESNESVHQRCRARQVLV